MQALHRTRSQHFVSSPRKTATPLKHKLARHSTKRRRLGSNSTTFAPLASTPGSSSDERDDRDLPDLPGSSHTRQRREKSTSEAGPQAVNRSGSRSRRKDKGKGKQDWKEGIPDDVFTSGDEPMSPKKRKRGDRDGDACSETTSSSWVEMDEDEEEPEFIAESDQHLLHDAPAHALHRLRKAELVRLWKVAGMWSEDDDEPVTAAVDDDDDGGLSKKELVDGLIAARRQSLDRRVSVDNSPGSPSHVSASVAKPNFVVKRLRSTSSSFPVSTASSSSSDRDQTTGDLQATPRAAPRTRSRVKKPEASLLRSVHRRPNGGKATRSRDGLFRSRSKSRGMEDRRARFGDNVKSPGKEATKRRTRRDSTQSSAYTTTDTSPPANPPPTRQTPRRRSFRHTTPATRRRSRSRVGFRDANDFEVIEIDSTDDELGEAVAPTPLVERLRPRARNSFVKDASSELEADGEEDSEVDTSEVSPIRTRRSSRNETNLKSDLPVRSQSRRNSRLLPDRGAKTKAMEALKGGESEEESMDVDPDAVEDEVRDVPRSGPLTRSQLKQQQEEGMEHGEGNEVEDDDADTSRERIPTSLTPVLSSDEEMEAEEESAVANEPNKGSSVRDAKRHSPQEDINGDVDETDDDADGAFEADVDLADATLSSLLRLLRDELVQMCESRGIEVGGTKPQLAQALLDWRDEQNLSDQKSTTSSQATAKPSSSQSKKIIHAIGSNKHVSGKTTPVLLRDHIHATDPATPPRSDDSKRAGEAELNLDLSELGLEDSIIKPSQLQKLEKIGSGGFKDVYVGKLRGKKVAISEFREHLSEMDIRELKLLAEFSHPNIVKFRGICIPEDNSQVPCMLVSELCENGDLFDYIRNVPCPPLKRVLGLMLDIARGLEYLHTRKPAIIHRDCKSSNILINRAGQAKVGDFGLARVKHSTRSMIRSLVGTVNWQAPELWHPHPRYDYKVDVFSAAVVYWEMMSGWIGEKKYPWEGHNEHYIYDAVGTKQRRPSVAGLRKHWGAEPVNLMERMWHQDPGERPTMTDVVVDLEVLIAECE